MSSAFGTIIQIGDILVSEEVALEYFACDYATCRGACCIYGDSGAMLFVESSEWQARNIHMITEKPVYCVDSNKMFS